MANHRYPQEPERQADLSRSTSTHRTKAKYPPRRDKVCLQLVKTNIVNSYNVYDFDLYYPIGRIKQNIDGIPIKVDKDTYHIELIHIPLIKN